ncbi:MAG: DUF748 domain-containing protein [Deltaproteobacteria bacterium]|nr:DUF748 domain-containing protein [Candidatus Tharpella aukensis]
MSDQEKPAKKFFSWRRILLFVVLLLAVYSVSGFFFLPWLLKSQAEKRLPELLNRPATIDQVRFNPFTLRLQIDGLLVRARQGRAPLLKIDSLLVDCAGFLSLSNRALVLEKIDIQGPYLKIVRNDDLSYNFSDLLPASPQSDVKLEVEGPGFRFSLNNIKLSGGIVEFTDQTRGIFHWLNDITIGLPQISNLPHLVETHVQPSFAAVVNGTPLAIKGTTKPFAETLETHFHINLNNLDLSYYLAYLPGERNFTVADGSLTTRLDLVYLQSENEVPSLTLSGTATLNDFLVSGREKKKKDRFVFLPEVLIRFAPGNLIGGELFLSEVVLRKPEVNLVIKPDGVFYLPMLVAAVIENPAPSESAEEVKAKTDQGEEEAEFVFKLDSLRLEEGDITLNDKRVTPAFSTRFSPVNFTLNDFSTVKDNQTHYSLKLISEVGETLTMVGEFSHDPVTVETYFALENLPLPRYAAYYRDYFAGQLDDGRLRLAGAVSFAQTDAGEFTLQLHEFECGLADLKVNDPNGEPAFTLPQLDLSQSRIDLTQRECVIGSLEGQKGALTLIRSADNILNLVSLLPAAPEKDSAAKDTTSKESTTEVSPMTKPWHLLLEKGRLHDFQVTFNDQQPAAKAVIKAAKINLSLDQLGTGKGESGTCQLDLKLAESGRLTVAGPLVLDPLQVELDIDLQKVPLKAFQAYISEHLDLVLVKGEAASKGHFSLRQKTSTETDITFAGNAALKNLKTVDGRHAADILALRNLALTGISFRNQPPAFSLEKVAVSGLQVNFVKESDGRSNFAMMMVEKEQAPETSVPAAKKGSPEMVKAESELAFALKKLELSKSSITFLDRSLSPPFKMVLADLEGGVEGLTSMGEKPARVKLDGRLNGQAPVSVSGRLDPLAQDLFVDLKIDSQGFGMTDLTPYTGKFVGYAVGKGKLSLDLEYKIENRKLTASNAIFLDQFDFGSSVESPDAMSLPVKLAVALLRDRQGEIHINMPVKGELDDPEFSLGGVIIKVFINLIAKAVTSPFALIGSLVGGGGGELNLVTFAPGQIELDDAAQGRLEKLAKALYDRPGLKVEIAGRADVTNDRQALHEDHFKKLLQAQKFKEVVGKKQGAQSLDEVVVEDAEFERYLWQAYKIAPFSKEKNLLRMVKKIEPTEQERLLRESIEISDDELVLLARNRARSVMAYLTAKGPVEAQRLFLVDPQIMQNDPAAAEKARQVEMKIQ